MKHFLITTTSIAGLAMCGATSVAAQTVEADATEAPAPATAPTDPTLAAMQLERDMEKANQERIVAKLAAAQAKLEYATLGIPTSDIAGIDGKVTVENSGGYYSEYLAYEALSATSLNIACAVSADLAGVNLTSANIILGDSADFGANSQLHTLLSTRFDMITERVIDVSTTDPVVKYSKDYPILVDNPFLSKDESALAVIGAVQGVLGVARGISQFFQTELTISGRVVSADQKTLDANLAHDLLLSNKTRLVTTENKKGKKRDKTAATTKGKTQICTTSSGSNPSLSVLLPGSGLSSTTGLFQKFDTLNSERNKLNQKKLKVVANAEAAAKEVTKKKTVLEKAGKALKDKLKVATDAGNRSEIENLNKFIAANTTQQAEKAEELKEIEKRKTSVIARIDLALSETDEFLKTLTTLNDVGKTPLQTVATIDQLKSSGNNYLLFADIASQGGELQMTKSSWSGTVGYLGGAIVTYMLIDNQGRVIGAGQYKSIKAKSKKRSANVESFAE